MLRTMFSREKTGLIALFCKVYELRDDPAGRRNLALEIQEDLLRRVARTERRIRSSRAEIRLIKATLATKGLDKSAARDLKQRIADNIEYVALCKRRLQLCGDVGDAVGFIYADRWDVKPLSNREKAGFLTGKCGARLERAVLRKIFESGRAAILNDLTNSFRFGDLTVFFEEGGFRIVEVKTGRGGKYSRRKRQMKAINEVMGYIVTDERNTDNGKYFRRATHQAPTYHVDAINRLLSSLGPRGWLHEEVEPGLHYFVIDVRSETPMDEVLSPIALTQCRPMMIFSNDLKYQGCSYYPFLLSFKDPEIAFRFYNGDVVIVVAVAMVHVSNVLAARDWKVHVTEELDMHWELEWTGKGEQVWDNNRVSVGAHMIGRLGGEFLSLDWFLGNVTHMAADIATLC